VLILVLVLVPDNQCVENFYLAAICAQWVDPDGFERERFGQPSAAPTNAFAVRTASVFQSLWPSADGQGRHEDDALR
jgi:hypothetical protein